MKAMNKLAVASLTSTSVKEIVSSMTTVANEKLKAEKAADAGKKKPGQKKKRLHVTRPKGKSFVMLTTTTTTIVYHLNSQRASQ